MDEFLATRWQLNRVSTDFLETDLRTALTFTKIARQTRDPERKARTRRNARKAYDMVVGYMTKVELTPSDVRVFSRLLKKLRFDLTELGETLS